ncbi:hypothetical protein F5I97DRAFT_1924250 [Phlebopus sp. FC_14]|nr:hypothetical protein F5I97DRAFT_1924250 [Phlebopus sp. FC_14]
MPAERRRAPPTISFRARSTIGSDRYKDIDFILKDLKSCSSRLRAAVDSFSDELRILERLFYKSKNQHRMALFFKRVSEIRRYGQRFIELDVSGRVDLLGASFVGLTSVEDSKALRKPWTWLPSKPYVFFVQERLKSCSTLVCKMRERLAKAYRHFSLAMQSGAFIQLVILFSAICSRISTLLAEIEEIVKQGTSICDRLLVIHDPMCNHEPRIQEVHQESPVGQEVPRHLIVEPDALEGLGDSVHRPVSTCASDNATQTSVPRSIALVTLLEMRITPPLASANVVAGVEHTQVAVEKSDNQAVKPVTTSTKKSKLLKKKKRDEIDDIFGF